MRAIVAGASGAIGLQLLSELCRASDFTEIIAISRKPLSLQAPKLRTHLIARLDDLQNINSQLNPDWSVDVLFCCLGTTLKTAGSRENFKKVDLDGVKILVSLAERLQLPHFLLISSAGASKNSSIFYNQVKGEAEDFLFSSKVKNITVFRPGLLLTDRNEFRFGERAAIMVMQMLTKVLPAKICARVATPAQTLVAAMLNSARKINPGKKIIGPNRLHR